MADVAILHQAHAAHPIAVKGAKKADLSLRDLLIQITIGRYAARKSLPTLPGL
jgi:hypothetical protein